MRWRRGVILALAGRAPTVARVLVLTPIFLTIAVIAIFTIVVAIVVLVLVVLLRSRRIVVLLWSAGSRRVLSLRRGPWSCWPVVWTLLPVASVVGHSENSGGKNRL